MGKEPWELAIEARRVNYARFATKANGYEHWECRNPSGGRDRLYVHQLLAVAEGATPSKLFSGRGQVHHKNGISWDNRPENIEVMAPSNHGKEHDDWEDAPWRDKDAILEGLRTFSVAALADEWGCSYSTIRNWMRRHGIERQAPGRKPDKQERTTTTNDDKNNSESE